MKKNPNEMEVLVSQEEINIINKRLAKEIKESYGNINDFIIMPILGGGNLFAMELGKEIGYPFTLLDFVQVSTYEGTQSVNKPKLIIEPGIELKGKHILLVDDVADTLKTLNFVTEELKKYQPASIKTVVMLSKPDKHQFEVTLDFVGKSFMGNPFVVGYGLDLDGIYRFLPDIRKYK